MNKNIIKKDGYIISIQSINTDYIIKTSSKNKKLNKVNVNLPTKKDKKIK